METCFTSFSKHSDTKQYVLSRVGVTWEQAAIQNNANEVADK